MIVGNKYLLDGKEIGWRELIKEGKRAGMDQSSGLLTTSAAAECLRENGHTVEESYEK